MMALGGFRKSDPPLTDRLVAKMTNSEDYEILLTEMEKQPKKALQSTSRSQQKTKLHSPSTATRSGGRRYGRMHDKPRWHRPC